jgi:hypothetical protein
MKRIATILSAIVIAASAFAKPDDKAFEPPSGAVIDKQDDKIPGLPSDAVIIEEQSLESGRRPDRSLILWMVDPTKHPSDPPLSPELPYTCIGQTRGSYYDGPARVSLINTKTRTVINTIKIEDYEGQDVLQIPYAIRKGFFYRVEGGAPESEEAPPHILWLKDYNGDGKALEFALFSKEACNEVQTTLIGYSERRDRVIQYPIYLKREGVGVRRSTVRQRWCNALFHLEPASPGHWKAEIDFTMRADAVYRQEIRYDAKAEVFVGKRVRTADTFEKTYRENLKGTK